MSQPPASSRPLHAESPPLAANTWPLVTVAIPLYRSARFLPIIIENIETLDYPNLEFIISDRHGADDALAQLAARFAHDPRMRFISAHDGIGWIAHYNSLLAAASGEYMLWLPHDDSYPADYILKLINALEANPAALLAFGTIQPVDEAGHPIKLVLAKNPWHTYVDATRPWSVDTALRLLIYWNLGIPMRGLFRRAHIVEAGLSIQPTPRQEWADVFWVFGVALRGPLQFVPEVICNKRFHTRNTHGAWPAIRGIPNRLAFLRVLWRYARQQIPHTKTRVRAHVVLGLYLFPLRGRHRILRGLVDRCSR